MSDDVIRTELAELRETMTAGFAYMHAGFARMDRYFELMQGQHMELRSEVQELRGEVQELRSMLVALIARVDGLEARVGGIEVRLDRLENEVRAFRDWVAGELADIRRELRLLRQAAEEREEFRRDVAALDARVRRLEKDWGERPD